MKLKIQATLRHAKPVILDNSLFFLKLVPNPKDFNEFLMSFYSPVLRPSIPNSSPVYAINVSDRGTNQIRQDLNKLVIPYMRQDILKEDHSALEKVLIRLRRIVLKEAQEYQGLSDDEKRTWKSITKLDIQKYSDIGVKIQEDGEPVERVASSSKHLNTLMTTLKKFHEQMRLINGQGKAAYIVDWMHEAESGHVTNPDCIKWLKNQENYYAPKDRSYAKYLNSLHPESPKEYL